MIQTHNTPGLDVVEFRRPGGIEYFLTVTPTAQEELPSFFDRAARAVRTRNARIVSREILGISPQREDAARIDQQAFGGLEGPLTWLEDGHEHRLYGMHIWAVSGYAVEPIRLAGHTIGSLFQDDQARFVRLGGVLPAADAGSDRGVQALSVFERLKAILHEQRMTFRQVVRTWFYNRDILQWYDQFNRVRDTFYRGQHVLDNLVPASTGVGGRNPQGCSLVGGLLAVEPLQPAVRAEAVPSPLQNPAWDYGSTFSRATELRLLDHRRLFVSGTASIDPAGQTAHVGDAAGQVALTMKVVQAILESRRMDWSCVTRALAYFKHAPDAGAFEPYCRRHRIGPFPVIVTENDICRDELLFEIEVDAVRAD
ncbi:MAG: hypothetical protein JW810_13570 [Sedimentisphaerales bacterium]|nr:hypothetical protein [Sedimentisphaerales bacterium]